MWHSFTWLAALPWHSLGSWLCIKLQFLVLSCLVALTTTCPQHADSMWSHVFWQNIKICLWAYYFFSAQNNNTYKFTKDGYQVASGWLRVIIHAGTDDTLALNPAIQKLHDFYKYTNLGKSTHIFLWVVALYWRNQGMCSQLALEKQRMLGSLFFFSQLHRLNHRHGTSRHFT